MKTLSCPFCGEKNEIELTGDYKDYICECSWCGAQSGRGDNEKEAIKNV